jgi:AraC-like DNA-binding protein
MDALADILKTLRLTANTYFSHDLASPWGMSLEKNQAGIFHVVISGSCWLGLDNGQKIIRLDTGDIVAFPTGGSHDISDMPETKKLPGDLVVKQLKNQQNPFSCSDDKPDNITSLMCGSFTYDTSFEHPFLRDLPCFIHIKAAETPELEWLRLLMKVLACESRKPSPGSSVIIDRLTEVLFIQLLRNYMKDNPEKIGYLSALADTQIGQALNFIHSEKKAYLTVEKLATSVAMSRTAFTEKFTKLIGIPPKTYLLHWRMQKAKNLLENTKFSMIEIAENTGYSSEAAFSKAFKQFFQQTPGKIRRYANASVVDAITP